MEISSSSRKRTSSGKAAVLFDRLGFGSLADLIEIQTLMNSLESSGAVVQKNVLRIERMNYSCAIDQLIEFLTHTCATKESIEMGSHLGVFKLVQCSRPMFMRMGSTEGGSAILLFLEIEPKFEKKIDSEKSMEEVVANDILSCICFDFQVQTPGAGKQ